MDELTESSLERDTRRQSHTYKNSHVPSGRSHLIVGLLVIQPVIHTVRMIHADHEQAILEAPCEDMLT